VVIQAEHVVCLQGFLVVLVTDIKNTVLPIVVWELKALLSRRQSHKAQAREQKQPQGEHGPEYHTPLENDFVSVNETVQLETSPKACEGMRIAAGGLEGKKKRQRVSGSSQASPKKSNSFLINSPAAITPSLLLTVNKKTKENGCQVYEVLVGGYHT